MLVALAAVIGESPATVIAQNDAAGTETELGATSRGGADLCQQNEQLPRGTVAVRVSLYALPGPRMEIRALSGTQTVTFGERASGWSGASVTIPIAEVRHTISPVTICLTSNEHGEAMPVLGARSPPSTAAYYGHGHRLAGRMRLVYLGHGHATWATLALSVARHLGRGRAWSGIWIAFLLIVLMLLALVLVSRLLLSELDV